MNKTILIKSVTWRIIASAISTLIGAVFGVSAAALGALFVADLVIKFVLYYLHELAWLKKLSK